MEPHFPLDTRKQQVLKAVVSDYTETGVPVGSQSLVARSLVHWSAATIRNELANLVEVGYLLQPHTSAGRIPSDLGYRYYVDFLMEEEQVPSGVRRQVDPRLPRHPMVLEELLESAAAALSLITDSVSIITGPRSATATLKHLDVVSLDARHALLLMVLEGNVVRQQVVELQADADQERLSALAQQLNGELRGLETEAVALSLRGVVDAPSELPVDTMRADVLEHLVHFMRSQAALMEAVVVHDGVRNLLHQPEFGDVERLEQVLEIVEQGAGLGALLAEMVPHQGMQIVIGSENSAPQLQGCSLVLTAYRAGGTLHGTIGVLGSTRMRYAQVSSRLRYVSQRVGESIDRLFS